MTDKSKALLAVADVANKYGILEGRAFDFADAAIAAYTNAVSGEAVAWLHTWKEKSGETGKSVRFSRADQEHAAKNLDRYLVAMVQGSSEISPLFAAPQPAPADDWFQHVTRFFVSHGMLDEEDEYDINDIMSALVDNYEPRPAPPAPAVPAGWMPIETAPKDGTGFLYFQKLPHNQKWIGTAIWHEGRFVQVQWAADVDEWLIIDPTHWMPLPAAPEAP